MAKATGKVQRKHVTITNFELQDRRIVKSQYKKWQLKIAKWIKVDVAEKYQYKYKIQYKGNVRLKSKDIICNSQGVMFVIVNEQNRRAIMVTIDSFIEKPNMRGNFYVIEQPSENKETNIKAIR